MNGKNLLLQRDRGQGPLCLRQDAYLSSVFLFVCLFAFALSSVGLLSVYRLMLRVHIILVGWRTGRME